MKKHHTLISTIALSALALAGCSSSSETASTPSPTATTPLDLGTYIPSTRDATPTAGSSNSSISSGTAASGKTQTTATPAAGSTAVPTLASGKTVEFTDEELAKYSAGEYVPANDKHPSYNVPVPVMPEAAKEKTAEGAVAFLNYWAETANYCMRTGVCDSAIASTDSANENMASQIELFSAIEAEYQNGNWIVGNEYSFQPDAASYLLIGESGLLETKETNSAGANFDKYGVKVETFEEENFNGQSLSYEFLWSDNNWVLTDVSGLVGAEYAEK